MTARFAVLLVGWLASGWVHAAPKLTILFTGDNGGEVTHCGCRTSPSGGLARRKVALQRELERGPALVVDAGNALFQHLGVNDEVGRKKARFIAKSMGQLGTFAMAVGARDLNAGPAFLVEAAAQSNLKLLSVNLQGKGGQRLFPASAIVQVGGVKVGVIGVSPAGPVLGQPEVRGAPMLPALLAEVGQLDGQVDFILVLAAVPYADALQLSSRAGKTVQLVIHSHDSRGPVAPQRVEHAHLVSGGDRGRHLGRLELLLGAGEAPFVDAAEVEREKQMLPMLDTRLKMLTERLARTKEADARKGLQVEVERMQASRQQHEESLAQLTGQQARTLRLDWLSLGPEVPDDPDLKAQVERLEPGGPAH